MHIYMIVISPMLLMTRTRTYLYLVFHLLRLYDHISLTGYLPSRPPSKYILWPCRHALCLALLHGVLPLELSVPAPPLHVNFSGFCNSMEASCSWWIARDFSFNGWTSYYVHPQAGQSICTGIEQTNTGDRFLWIGFAKISLGFANLMNLGALYDRCVCNMTWIKDKTVGFFIHFISN